MLPVLMRKKSDDKQIMWIHHTLCMNYGWIPIEEFKRLPIPAVLEMIEMLEKTQREASKKMKKPKR